MCHPREVPGSIVQVKYLVNIRIDKKWRDNFFGFKVFVHMGNKASIVHMIGHDQMTKARLAFPRVLCCGVIGSKMIFSPKYEVAVSSFYEHWEQIRRWLFRNIGCLQGFQWIPHVLRPQ